jgi:acetyl esterase
MLHPQAEAALEIWGSGPRVAEPGFGRAAIEELRRTALEEAAAEPKEPVERVSDVDAGGVPARVYLPADAREGTLVFLHGGGFVFGDLDTHDAQARRLANRTRTGVLSVDYRRPPEHRFPAAPADVDRALHWLRDGKGAGHGLAGPLVLLGDSAGGNLALVGALRNPGLLDALVLVYPFLDPELRSATYRDANAGLTRAEAAWYWEQYADRPRDHRDPDLAPLLSTWLGTVPPTLVQAAEHDALLGEDLELARRIAAAGGTVTTTTYPGMVHGFWRHPALFDDAETALAEIAGFLARTV